MSRGLLAGLRVVEAGAFVAAPLGGMTLAQMGADVIRIDPPGGGLDYRRWPVTQDDRSLFWSGLNKGKRSVCIDTRQVEGRELAMALIAAPGADAGIFLTNFPPRGWSSYQSLRARRADLIQLTLTGRRDGTSAVDYTVNAITGLPFLTGPRGYDGPVNHVLPAWDLVTGQLAATGLLAAERHRSRTGEGQHVKLALEDVALATLGNLGLIAEAQLGRVRERSGNDLYGAFGRDFATADGARVMIVALTGRQWTALCEALGLHEAVRELEMRLGIDLSREGDRHDAREPLAALVQECIGGLDLAAASSRFEACGVCWSRYRTVGELVAEELASSTANPLFTLVDHPGVGELLTPALPLEFAAGGRVPALSAPELGQHTTEVLEGLLGLGGAEIRRLQGTGVIGGLLPV